VVFTPGSTLRNNNKANTADVPWYAKFTTSPHNYPYPGNDQHPYLIWNMYRITDGQLEQIGASGVKHAWLTTNTGCAPDACTGGGHILGRNCGDTYGVGNNDAPNDLGPRSEIVPATGQWGRCGSIFDLNCDGIANSSGNGPYDQRMVIRESQMLVPNSQYFSESWYLVQDDIDIYNTMAHRTMTPAPGGTGWVVGTQGPFQLGPTLNTWVNPQTFPNRNVEHASEKGHVRVAVKVKELDACPAGSGLTMPCYRWDYAVNNFDWAHAVTQGNPPNLRVLENKGFAAFTLDMPSSTPLYLEPGVHFADTDIDTSNNWTATQDAGSISWQGPVGNELNWGLLFRFSLVTNRNADDAMRGYATLHPDNAQAEAPVLRIMVPGSNSAPTGVGSIADQSSLEGENVSLSVTASFSDPDADPLTFSATGLPPQLQISPTGTVSGTVADAAAGSYTVVVTARDPWDASATQSFGWTITAGVNNPPVAIGSIPDQQHAEGDEVSLATAAFFFDTDGDPLTYSSTVLPDGIDLDTDTGVITGTLSFVAAGNYNVIVTATDPSDESATQAFEWTVTDTNRPPVAVGSIADQVDTQGLPLTLDISGFFTDPDGDTLTYQAQDLPAGLLLDEATGVITGTAEIGSHDVIITASDPDGESATQAFSWEILEFVPQIFLDGFESN
jgi:hypothetical protein